MNRNERIEYLNRSLPGLWENVRMVRKFNQIAAIHGTRHELPLEGRSIEIAYYPAPGKNAPLIIGIHGGGFLFGGSALDDDLWVNVSKTLNMNVASVDYRMSPDVTDEACLMDCYDSMLYLYEHASDFSFDPAHINVFGSSAGGNIAAAMCILAKQRGDITIENQFLMYPFLDGDTNPDIKGEGSFSGLMPHIMNKLHFSEGKSKEPLCSPAFADVQQLQGLPNTVISYCEFDNLKDEAINYANMLKKANVKVHEFFASRMPHGYIESGFKKHLSDMDLQMLGDNKDELIENGLLRQRSEETLAFIAENLILNS